MAGGNDGLNTVVPYTDSHYQSLQTDYRVQGHRTQGCERQLDNSWKRSVRAKPGDERDEIAVRRKEGRNRPRRRLSEPESLTFLFARTSGGQPIPTPREMAGSESTLTRSCSDNPDCRRYPSEARCQRRFMPTRWWSRASRPRTEPIFRSIYLSNRRVASPATRTTS